MKTVRLLFGIFLFVVVIFVSWKVVPAYFANYQFQEEIDDLARMGAVDIRKQPEDIRAAVLERAQARDIPLSADDIAVTRNGGDVLISARYTVHVDVPVYPFDMKFTPSTKREALSLK
jgi:Domain of unknown function (DUF4845)